MSAVRADAGPVVVVLFRQGEEQWQIVDHFVLERPGRWAFATGPGRYAVAAFADRSRDLVYQPGEPYGTTALDRPLACTPGAGLDGLVVSIPEQVRDPFPGVVDITALQRRNAADQAQRTLGQLTVAGEIASLSDARFS